MQLQWTLCHICRGVYKQSPLCTMHWQRVRFMECASQEAVLCWQTCTAAAGPAALTEQLQSSTSPGRLVCWWLRWAIRLAAILFAYGKYIVRSLRSSLYSSRKSGYNSPTAWWFIALVSSRGSHLVYYWSTNGATGCLAGHNRGLCLALPPHHLQSSFGFSGLVFIKLFHIFLLGLCA